MPENNRQNKILIIIPAYNEEKNIKQVVDSLRMENDKWDILVVNDGSSDNTGLIAGTLKSCSVINLRNNLGIGGAVETGFKYAVNKNYDIAVQFDGDGQHKASEIDKLLQPILNSEADAVIGSRFLTKHDGWKPVFYRKFAIKLFMLINSILIRQKITDNTSGFRAYNKKAISFLSDNYPMDYPEPEAVILLGKNGFKIVEIAAEMLERQGGESSIKGFKNIYYFIKVLLSVLITSIKPKVKQVRE